jgi:tetratricopeptide (TPR) repeat protein
MVYFNQALGRPTSREDTEQWGKVLEFREQFPKEGLWWSYDGAQEFERIFREHLQRFLLNLDDQKLLRGQVPSIFDAPMFADAIPRIPLWEKIETAFREHPVVAIGGLSGSGKTYLMSSFTAARLDSGTDRRVLWHDPSEGESLDSLLASLGADISLPGFATASRCKALIAFLRHQKALLIIDNFHTVDQPTYSLLVELFTRAGPPCRLVLLSQAQVVPRTTSPDVYHVSVPAFSLEETRRFLDRRGLRSLADDVLLDLLEKTGGLPFAISLFAVLVGEYDPRELLSGTMASGTRIQDWFTRVLALIGPEAQQLLHFLSLSDGPFNRGVVRMLSLLAGATNSDAAFEQLRSHYLVGNHSPYRWKVHDLISYLSRSSLDAGSRDKGHSALGRYFLRGLPQKPNIILSEEQFVWKVRAYRHLRRSKVDLNFARAVLKELASTAKARGHYAMFVELSAEVVTSQPDRDRWIDYHHAHCALVLGYSAYSLRMMEPLLYDADVIRSPTQRLAFTRLYAEALGSMGEEQAAMAALKPTLESAHSGGVSSVAHSQAKSVLVWLLTRVGNYADASDVCDELLAEAQRMRLERGGAVALTRKGVILLGRALPKEAADLFTTATELFRHVGDRRGEAWSLSKLAECQLLLCDEASALRTFREASAINLDIGECGIDYRESIARMKSETKSQKLVQLIDQETERMELAAKFGLGRLTN